MKSNTRNTSGKRGTRKRNSGPRSLPLSNLPQDQTLRLSGIALNGYLLVQRPLSQRSRNVARLYFCSTYSKPLLLAELSLDNLVPLLKSFTSQNKLNMSSKGKLKKYLDSLETLTFSCS